MYFFKTITENDRLVEYSSYLMMALFQILLFCWPGGKMLFEVTETDYKHIFAFFLNFSD